MLPKLVPIAIATALLGWSAQAATLTNIEGVVFINQGYGFHQAATGTELNAGDRVRAKAGSADIVYANGCSSRVGQDQMAVVLSTPPSCSAGAGGLKDGPVEPMIYEEPSAAPLVVWGAAAVGVGIAIAATGTTEKFPLEFPPVHPASR
jgi:hypothetical protein